jgi:hypothetical protein
MSEPLTFVFCRQHSLGSLAIRASGYWADWSHCGLVDDNGVIEALAFKGVVWTPLRELEERSSHFAYVRLLCPRPAEGLAYARSRIGMRYDWHGIAALMLRARHVQRPGADYCSEQGAAIAAAAGVQLTNDRLHGTHPMSLYNLMLAANAGARAQ